VDTLPENLGTSVQVERLILFRLSLLLSIGILGLSAVTLTRGVTPPQQGIAPPITALHCPVCNSKNPVQASFLTSFGDSSYPRREAPL